MDFNTAINDLEKYLDKQGQLDKIETINDLEFINDAICLLVNSKGEVFHLPDDKMYKKTIFFFEEDPAKTTLSKENPKPVFTKQNSIHSAITLYETFINNKMIKSAYQNLFDHYPSIDYLDNLVVVRKTEGSSTYDYIVIKGTMSENDNVPDFLSESTNTGVYSFRTTPHTLPPKKELFEPTYRQLKESMKVKWNINQIRAYLEAIWVERSPSTLLSRINLLFESTVLLAEKSDMFNQILRTDKKQNRMVGIPSNFVLGICGGYARGEYSKTSDLDMLLIHEGNDKQFGNVGAALHEILKNVPNLELCNVENFLNLYFHEDSISDILLAFLNGDESYINPPSQQLAITEMIKSIEQIRQSPLSPDERKDGISKYCWSIYKSIINMVPIYEKPLGKGPYLREKLTKSTKQSLHKIIPLLLRISDSLMEKEMLGESIKVCQPYVYESIFKKYSVLTSLQDLSTILNLINESDFTSSTVERFNLAKKNRIITEEQAEIITKTYSLFSQTKYKLRQEMPIDAIALINDEAKKTIIDIYNSILDNLEPVVEKTKEIKIAYPLLVFSDLHWGLNSKLANKSLSEIKRICEKNQVKSIIINGDILNVDIVNELAESDKEGTALINELSEIQKILGDQRIHLIAGNHDPDNYYSRFQNKLVRELDIHYLGNSYKNDKLYIEHGHLNFWDQLSLPMDDYLMKFRENYDLKDQTIIVGHNHRIYNEKELGFYGNGAIGKSFSSILVKKNSVELIETPIVYEINFEEILKEYKEIINADELIEEHIQKNFELVEWNAYAESIEVSSDKRTWIITDNGDPIGIIPFNRVEEVNQLKNIQVYEICYPLDYTFTKGQKLKEAWGVFSVTGAPLLPVKNIDNEIIGTLSIFSIPKPQKEHATTKDVEIDDEMKNVGDSLVEKLLERQKKTE